MPEEIANVDAAEGWAGEAEHWVEHAELYDAGMRPHTAHLLDAAAIAPDDAVLDIGCGVGETTRESARLAKSGRALGVDLTERMLERARERAGEEGLTNVDFVRTDAQVHDFEREAFTVAVSRFGGSFFGDPVAAYRNLAAALNPGGRLAVLTWQRMDDNEWVSSIRGALAAGRDLPLPPPNAPGPFGLADPDYTRSVLDDAGFADVELEDVHEPMAFGGTTDEAFAFMRSAGFVRGTLADLDDEATRGALEELRRVLDAHHTSDGVRFDSASWLVTARRSG